MKDVSPETQRVLEAVRRTSEILDNLDINDHAATIATLQVLAQRRVAKHNEERAQMTHRAESVLRVS